MNSPRQLLLDLPHRIAMGRDDFLVAESNSAAVKLIDDWPHWPAHAGLLVGPEGSGKSHLAQVWQMKSGAKIMPLSDLPIMNIPQILEAGALCLEHVQGRQFDETALFHALNHAKQNGGSILLTSREEASAWLIKLPDLDSRLKAIPMVRIEPPNDSLLRGVLVKLFADRQINVDESLVSYMLTRMPRSLAAARYLVTEIDNQALVEKAEVTRPFVGRVIAALESPRLFEID